jgi:hypothetical protein
MAVGYSAFPAARRLTKNLESNFMRVWRFVLIFFVVLWPMSRAFGQQTIRCDSANGKRHSCPVDTHAGVQLVKQRGSSPCARGYSWDFDEHGIWVNHGCRGSFVIGGKAGAGEAQERSCKDAIGAARANQLVKECVQVSPATHPPCNAQNSCKLITDEIRRSCPLLGHDAPGFCEQYM